MAILLYYVMYTRDLLGYFNNKHCTASMALIPERITQSLQIAPVQQAWPIQPKGPVHEINSRYTLDS